MILHRNIKMTDENQTKEPEVPVKAKKAISLDKFKSWLEGVEEMQDADWHPTAAQWRTIRDKFDLIKEEEAPRAPAPAPVAAGPLPMYRQPGNAAMDNGPSLEAAPPMPDIEISPAAKAMLQGKGYTPDVDSTDGSFDSPFT